MRWGYYFAGIMILVCTAFMVKSFRGDFGFIQVVEIAVEASVAFWFFWKANSTASGAQK